MSMFSQNLENLRRFLSKEEGQNISQASISKRIRISLSTWQKWAADQKHGRDSYNKVISFLNSTLRDVAPFEEADLLENDLISVIESRRAHGKKSVTDPKSYSRWSLQGLLTDHPLCRILGIDDGLRIRLSELVESYRGDLDKDDWAAVVRMVQEGREDKDDWKYKDPEARKLQVHFKSTRVLRPDERTRIEKIVQEEVEKLAQKERHAQKQK